MGTDMENIWKMVNPRELSGPKIALAKISKTCRHHPRNEILPQNEDRQVYLTIIPKLQNLKSYHKVVLKAYTHHTLLNESHHSSP